MIAGMTFGAGAATSSDALAAAYNRGLGDVVRAIGLGAPRVEAVDPGYESVTMISA